LYYSVRHVHMSTLDVQFHACQVTGTLTEDTRGVSDRLGQQLLAVRQELQAVAGSKADKVLLQGVKGGRALLSSTTSAA
jgi:hypothetical protein